MLRRDKESNAPIKTGSIKINFDASLGSPLPDRLFLFMKLFHASYLSEILYSVQKSKCQSFGHTTSSCRSTKTTCAKCGGLHLTTECHSESQCCPNCKGDHPAYSRDCPKFTFAQNIELVSASKRISYSDAIKVIRSSHPPIPVCNQPEFFPPLIQKTSNSLNNIAPQPRPNPLSINVPTTNTGITIAPTGIIKPSVTPDPISNPELLSNFNNCPSLSDICPPSELKQFILDIYKLFQRKLKEHILQTSLLQLINNFLNPRLHRTASSSSSTKSKSSNISNTGTHKCKKNKR
jgi:hypothetical protein